jgi:hypothetical protein
MHKVLENLCKHVAEPDIHVQTSRLPSNSLVAQRDEAGGSPLCYKMMLKHSSVNFLKKFIQSIGLDMANVLNTNSNACCYISGIIKNSLLTF